MKHLINARILAPDAASFFPGEVLIDDGGRIRAVGTTLAEPDAAEVIDCKGGLLLPGFKNAHTHSAMTFLRSRADDKPLSAWLNETVFPREAKLTPDDVYWLTLLAVAEYVRGGTTACFDMYFHTDAFVSACKTAGFRAVLCGSATAFEKDPIGTVARLYEDHNGKDPLIGARLGFHAEYTANEAMLRELSALSHEKKAPVFVHLSETKAEVDECAARHGLTPAKYIDSLGLWDFGGGGFHCVHLTDEEIGLFADKNLSAVSCPASNLKLASGIAPLHKFFDAGVNVALGTDGPASNNALSMFRELYLAATLQKALTGKAELIGAQKILKAATLGGADAMGLSTAREIQVGQWADLTLINTDLPNLRPSADPIKSLVYSAGDQNVALTMVAGRILYRDGEFFLGEDIDQIYQKAQSITERIEAEF